MNNKKNHNYKRQYIYIPKDKRAFIKEKLGRDAEGKEFVDAFVEKLDKSVIPSSIVK